MVHGYSNDFGAYIPSERLVANGGYGGGAEIPYFALPTTLSAGLEQKIVTEVLNQSPDEFNVPEGTQGVPPKSPADSLKCMTTHPELRVELVAAEPLITDPVAIDFGPDGKLWVCQMNDYAHGVEDEFPESSEVRVLTDSNHDGQYDQSDVFVDGLRYPTDVKVWRNGVLICDAPHIYFAADTDGDKQGGCEANSLHGLCYSQRPGPRQQSAMGTRSLAVCVQRSVRRQDSQRTRRGDRCHRSGLSPESGYRSD